MPADPVVSPAATPDAATPSLPSGCGCDGNPAGGVCSYPDCQLPPPTTAELLGPVSAVSPADARVGDLELWALEASVEDIVALVRDRAALLAVGERDKAERQQAEAEIVRVVTEAWTVVDTNYATSGATIQGKASLWTAIADLESALRALSASRAVLADEEDAG